MNDYEQSSYAAGHPESDVLTRWLGEQLTAILEKTCVEYSPRQSATHPAYAQLEQLVTYALLLQSWSKWVDLVSAKSLKEILLRHIIDSAAAWWLMATQADVSRETSVVDVGSGAGLPGIVWAILAPQRQFYLIEPRDKRVQFLKEAVRRLKLANVAIIAERIEEVSAQEVQASGIFVSRAVGHETELMSNLGKIANNRPTVCLLVGESWECPKSLVSRFLMIKQFKYLLPQSSTHKLFIGECFT